MHQTAPGLLSIANYTQFDDTLPVVIHPHGAMRPHFAYCIIPALVGALL